MHPISRFIQASVFVALTSFPFVVQAAESCTPKSEQGKVLRSKDIKDIDSYVGSAWSLTNIRREGNFLSGVLITPRQNVGTKRVFVIADEWDCG
jgi:hypothetical protein